MPRVPSSNQFGNLQLGGPAIPLQNPNVPRGTFTGGTELQAAGAVASEALEAVQQLQGQRDGIQLSNAMTEGRGQAHSILNNPQDGIFTLTGASTIGAKQQSIDRMDTLGNEIKATLPKRSHAAFNLEWANLTNSTGNQAGRFELEQHGVNLKNSINGARESWKLQVANDPSQAPVAIQQMFGFLSTKIEDPAIREDIFEEFRSEIHETTVDSFLLAKDYQSAQAYFDTNVEEIDPDKRNTLSRSIEQYTQRQTAFDGADQIMNALGPEASFDDYSDLADELVRKGIMEVDTRDRAMSRIADRMRTDFNQQQAADSARLDSINDQITLGRKVDELPDEDILWLTQQGQYAEMVVAEQKVSAGKIKTTNAGRFRQILTAISENKVPKGYSPFRDDGLSTADAQTIEKKLEDLRNPKTAAGTQVSTRTENQWLTSNLDRIDDEDEQDIFTARFNEAVTFKEEQKRKAGENPDLTDAEYLEIGNGLRAGIGTRTGVGRFNPLRILPLVSSTEQQAFQIPPEERTVSGRVVGPLQFQSIQQGLTEAGIEDDSDAFIGFLDTSAQQLGIEVNQFTDREIQAGIEEFQRARQVDPRLRQDLARAGEATEERRQERIRELKENQINTTTPRELSFLRGQLAQDTGVRRTIPNVRNLSDDELNAIALEIRRRDL